MKFKITGKGKENIEKKKEENIKRGRKSKRKGSSYERNIAKKFKEVYKEDLVRTPQSGGFAKKSVKADGFRGDIVLSSDKEFLLHIECKNTQTWVLPKWIEQAENDCPEGKKPIVIFHKHNTSKNYVTMSLEDFFSLIPKELIIKEQEK